MREGEKVHYTYCYIWIATEILRCHYGDTLLKEHYCHREYHDWSYMVWLTYAFFIESYHLSLLMLFSHQLRCYVMSIFLWASTPFMFVFTITATLRYMSRLRRYQLILLPICRIYDELPLRRHHAYFEIAVTILLKMIIIILSLPRYYTLAIISFIIATIYCFDAAIITPLPPL